MGDLSLTLSYSEGYESVLDNVLNLGSISIISQTEARITSSWGELVLHGTGLQGAGSRQFAAGQVTSFELYNTIEGRDLIVSGTDFTQMSAAHLNTVFTLFDNNIPTPHEFSLLDAVTVFLPEAVRIFGNSPVFLFVGGSFADEMHGGAGDNGYVWRGGDRIIDAGGRDVISTFGSFDLSRTGFGFENIEDISNESIVGGTLIGNDLNNTIWGSRQDDIMYGGAGNDLLMGDRGTNHFIGGPGQDTLDGYTGNDSYFLEDGTDSVTDAGGDDSIYSTVTRSLAGYAGIERLVLQGNADIDGAGNALANRITGNSGDNALSGAGADDVLQGGSGRDALDGGAGDDAYMLDNGADTIVDASGYDVIFSTVGRSLAGYTAVERLILQGTADINGAGNDRDNRINGNSGDNGLTGGIGDDQLTGGLGDDTYFLEHGNDTVIDSGGTDTIASTISRRLSDHPEIERLVLQGTADSYGYGNNLPNVIIGNSGDNKLNGGNGNDVLAGGGGTDALTGNANNDVFRFHAVADTGVGNRDIITDFTQGSDRIDLSPIDGNGPIAGDPHFVFIGTANFTSGGGRLRYFQIDNADNALDQTVVEGDINGNGVADFQIQLTGLITLAQADFIV